MFFSAKSKGFFIEQNEHVTLLARTSTVAVPLVIEELRECPTGDAEALAQALKELQPKKSPSGYLQAVCGVYPAKRLVRRATLELKRVKDPAYFPEIINQQFRVEADKYATVVLNANDGSDFDPNRPAPQKEVLFGGIPADAVVEVQNALLEQGIYPERLELGSIATLGAIADLLAFTGDKTPVLVLEIGPDSTHSYIVSSTGVEASRPIPQGYEAMVPVVQKELGLKDEESARKLFFSNTFDFTGMGPILTRRLVKELQSSIGFYEVQTGQSVGLLHCTQLPQKLAWLGGAVATALGVSPLKLELPAWLESRKITLAENVQQAMDDRWLGLFSLMVDHKASTPAPDAVAEKKD
jgi:Tfp pilus assembly PilM family ATPase